MDVNNAALEAFISLGWRFKHSHFHAVKNRIRDFDVFRGHRLQLVEGANQIIQDYQVMAESQIVNQVTLMGGKEEGKKFLLLQSVSQAAALVCNTTAFKQQVLHGSYNIHWKMEFYQEPLMLLKLY